MNRYETLYIIQPNLPDDQVEEIVRLFEGVIPENRGTLVKTDKWGKRKLAYRIGRHWEGYYVIYEYDGDGATQRELERRLKIHDHVIRHMTTRVDPRMAAELERRAEREKRGEGRRDDGGEGWGEGRFGNGDRDDYHGRGPRRDRGERGERA
jgi:small subunit ribosomal protein S6